jgi:hypothetical protein
MSNDAREKLILELERLLQHKPPMGTLFITVREMPYMLIVTLEDGVIRLCYPHTGWLNSSGRIDSRPSAKHEGFGYERNRGGKRA